MVDMHMHTTNSDGSDTVEELIKKAEKLNLHYISITDHDTCNAYFEIKENQLDKLFSGKIIVGIELKCIYNNSSIEVLGYKFDINKMKNWLDNFYKNKTKKQLQTKYFNQLYDLCKKVGFKLTPKGKIEWDPSKDWASFIIYTDLKKYPENDGIYADDILKDFITFNKKYVADLKCPLYIDKTKDFPSIEEAIEAIKNAGGLVFMPHMFIYKAIKNKRAFIDDIANNYCIDGIECYHSEFSDEEIEYMLKYTKTHHLLRSGGSDYHGINKENIEMAVGNGNLKIEDNIVIDWI